MAFQKVPQEMLIYQYDSGWLFLGDFEIIPLTHWQSKIED
jgi:hypothetical protein